LRYFAFISSTNSSEAMKNLFFYAFLAIIALSCNRSKKPKAAVSSGVTDVFDAYYKERMRLFPLEATSNGINDYNDQLPIEISESFRDSVRRFLKRYQGLIEKSDVAKMDDSEKTSVEIFKWELTQSLAALNFNDHYMPINQFWGFPLTLGQLASGDGNQPFKNVKDYDNWMKRVEKFPMWVDTAIANMERGMATGYVLPKALVVKILPQLEPMFKTLTPKHLFYQPILKLAKNDSMEAYEKDRFKTQYALMVDKTVKPNYKKLHDFLKVKYLPKARMSAGISDIPKGREMYNQLIKQWTTTNLTADEVFELGQKEVARIRLEMEAVKTEVGYKKDLKSFFKFVNDRKANKPYKKPEQIIDDFNKIHETMKPQLEKMFDMTPKTPFEVRRTEPFREASASAEYNQGSPDGTRPGIFYFPIPKGNAAAINNFQNEALFLHEAIPGHHYQISLQQENTELPDFRKFLWYGAYGEGWALYTESLGKELGLYTDPYQYFGKLGMEMHRAIRLVVDAGLHTKGWTREQAIQYDMDNEAETLEGVTAEIERYMAIPGQALSYKVGQLKILELRHKAEKALGENFDIRKFHNEVLKDGCVPLALLEQKVDKMIAAATAPDPKPTKKGKKK
jgi:uncharacterized protein (DUF885 family)